MSMIMEVSQAIEAAWAQANSPTGFCDTTILARAAIEAMHNPTFEMAVAGGRAYAKAKGPLFVWQAMIEEAGRE